MSTYTTKTQMIERYGEDRLISLTDRAEPPAGAIDDAVLDRAIASAEGEIDGYVSSRYALPLSAVPEVLHGIAAQITYLNLHIDHAPDLVSAGAAEARRKLRDIAAGTLRLEADGTAEAASGGGDVKVAGGTRLVSDADLEGF